MKNTIFPLGLTYDDVLLVPLKSDLVSRSEANVSTHISRHIPIALPFISSNIDTVTEHAMAIEMAKLGGIGCIHRFMSIDQQVEEVKIVKRAEGFIMDKPFTLPPTATIKEAKIQMKEREVTSAIIVDDDYHVLGLVSERDMWFSDNNALTLGAIMTPFERLITGSVGITITKARDIFKKNKVEKLPLIDSKRKLVGLITSRTVLNEERYPYATKDKKKRLRVLASVGVVDEYEERAKALIRAGVDGLIVDIAHIHSKHGLGAVKKIRSLARHIDVIAGNIVTKEAARDLIRLGVDGVKVGIGPGGICITRIVAGAGYPQFSAIQECASVCHKNSVPLIADGGTNYAGDMAKGLAAGASSIMLAGWLAGTDESPGVIIYRKGNKYKIHRGAASFTAVASRKIAKENSSILPKHLDEVVAEGVESFIPYKGAVKDVIVQLTGAVRSGMSYSNAKTIPELWKRAKFVQITKAGLKESMQHNVEEM